MAPRTSHFKVLTEKMTKEQYIWTQCGSTAPTDAEISAVAPLETGYLRKLFTIPLQKASTYGTTGLGFLRRLDAQGRVSHADQSAPGPCWQNAHACGAQLEASWGGNATIREAQLNAAEAVFMDGSGKCKVLRAWPKCSALLCHQRQRQPTQCRDIKLSVTAYAAASLQVAARPVVAWIQYSSYAGGFVLSQVAFKTQHTSTAGGTCINGTAFAEVSLLHGSGSHCHLVCLSACCSDERWCDAVASDSVSTEP
jgi:hypothetical protein